MDTNIDDIYPNNGQPYYPPANKELEKEAIDEAAVISSALPIFEELIEWLNTSIDATDSIREASVMATSKGKSIETVTLAFEIVRELLQIKKEELTTKAKTHSKR